MSGRAALVHGFALTLAAGSFVACDLFDPYVTAVGAGGAGAGAVTGGAGGIASGGGGMGAASTGGAGGAGGNGGAGGAVGECPELCAGGGCPTQEDCWTLSAETSVGNAACGEVAKTTDLYFDEDLGGDSVRFRDLAYINGMTVGAGSFRGLFASQSWPEPSALLADLSHLDNPLRLATIQPASSQSVRFEAIVRPQTSTGYADGYAVLGDRVGQPTGFATTATLPSAFSARYLEIETPLFTPQYIHEPSANAMWRSRFVAGATTADPLDSDKPATLNVLAVQEGQTYSSTNGPLARLDLLRFGSDAAVSTVVGTTLAALACGAGDPFDPFAWEPFPADVVSFPGETSLYLAWSACGHAYYSVRNGPTLEGVDIELGGMGNDVRIAGIETLDDRLLIAGTFKGTLSVGPLGELTATGATTRDAFVLLVDKGLTIVAAEHFGGMGEVDLFDVHARLRAEPQQGQPGEYGVYLVGQAQGDVQWGCFGGDAGPLPRALLAKLLIRPADPDPTVQALYVKIFGQEGVSRLTSVLAGGGGLYVAGEMMPSASIDVTPSYGNDPLSERTTMADGAGFVMRLRDGSAESVGPIQP